MSRRLFQAALTARSISRIVALVAFLIVVASGYLLTRWVKRSEVERRHAAPVREWFVHSARFNRGGTGRNTTTCESLLHYDFQSGERKILEDHDPSALNQRVLVSLMDRHGYPLRVRTDADVRFGNAKYFSGLNRDRSPAAVLDRLTPRGMHPASVSPDGNWLVFYDYAAAELVVGSADTTHRIPTKWWITRPFSWIHDSSKVAFYYAADSYGDDVHVQQHGVAVLTTDGQLKSIVSPDPVGTKHTPGKDIPVGWNPKGTEIFFTTGFAVSDAMRDEGVLPTVVSRANIQTGRVELIAPGEFVDISPQGEYAIVAQYGSTPRRTNTYRLDLESLRLTELPREAAYPRLSPSGEYTAVFPVEGKIACMRTSDWKLVGEPVPMIGNGLSIEDWCSDYRWIVVDANGWKPD